MLASKGMRFAGTFTTRNNNMFRRSFTAATARAVAFPAAARQQQARVFGLVLAVTCAATSTMILPSYDTNKTYNHCQVPCGIFDDPAMVMELQQAVVTIRKAMAQTQALVAGNGSSNNNNNIISEEALAVNQAVRWIHDKEQHANRIIHLVTDYCLCQRVKQNLFPNQAAYWEALQIHHQVLQAAMKAKQSVSEVDVDALQVAVNDLAKMYTK